MRCVTTSGAPQPSAINARNCGSVTSANCTRCKPRNASNYLLPWGTEPHLQMIAHLHEHDDCFFKFVELVNRHVR